MSISSMKVNWLKRRLRKKYIRWNAILDEYSCGMAVAREVSPRLSGFEAGMDRLIVKLKVLGEDVPQMPWEKA